MVLLEIIMTAFLLFIGSYGILAAYKMDGKSLNRASRNPESALFALLPLKLAKLVLFIFSLLPIAIVIGMWLQTYDVIE